jgi:hypothetical protein
LSGKTSQNSQLQPIYQPKSTPDPNGLTTPCVAYMVEP